MFSLVLTFYYELLYTVTDFLKKRRVSEMNGQNQHASRMNVALTRCWTNFAAIFPLASSLDTASGLNGQQQLLRDQPRRMTADLSDFVVAY
jgi:hypothetical protein